MTKTRKSVVIAAFIAACGGGGFIAGATYEAATGARVDALTDEDYPTDQDVACAVAYNRADAAIKAARAEAAATCSAAHADSGRGEAAYDRSEAVCAAAQEGLYAFYAAYATGESSLSGCTRAPRWIGGTRQR